ncbi:MAG: substrate-binding domain-containing protein [Dethiobacter sp.]|nr:substrate-binding domain-containing protein [Dethiobacter sp.]
MKKKGFLLCLLLAAGLAAVGCAGQNAAPAAAETNGVKKGLILATTTSTYDSGLLDWVLPVFSEKYGYKVKVVSLGTGQALELAKNGDADVVLVHAREVELEMVRQGHFVGRHDVMYNDFVIVGPKADPVGIKGLSEINRVFLTLAEKRAPFISRGDDSGTHKKELSLWQGAGISPQGDWYISVGSGMSGTLRIADEKEGYTLTDRATYLSLQDKLDSVIIFEGDPQLFNQYGIMAVNPDNYPKLNYKGAEALIQFFISQEGQKRVSDFKPFGDTLFFPNAK